ncbi:MAG: methylated-DNA--[protein]-cysteine S-methyltransferase [Deltaproteobacteria bacterium]|nr:methylated-DNA--[protein]-cysteine S-methyltransferase [Deltaproteobacteria bacterium]
MEYVLFSSPLGTLLLAGENNVLRELRLPQGKPPQPDPGWIENPAGFVEGVRQIGEYFAGKRRAFQLPLAPQGTPFQRQVWQELSRIPHGQTMTYGALAARIGQPSAARAVGGANGANPLPLLIPCHRVVAGNGLGGYSSGLEIKRFLLNLEGILPEDAGRVDGCLPAPSDLLATTSP